MNITLKGISKRTMRDGDYERTYYSGTFTSDIAKELTYVPAYPDPNNELPNLLNVRYEDGYQRAGQISRMRIFSRFLTDKPLSIVPPVILSTRGSWEFESILGDNPDIDSIVEEGEDFGELEITDAAAVIDGQHRLGGYIHKFENDNEPMTIDFIAIDDMEIKEEMAEFSIINSSQNRVSPSLINVIGVLGDGDEDAYIAMQLDLREDSPFHGKIGHEKAGPDQLYNIAMVTRNVKRLFNNGAFSDVEADEKVDIAIRYWDIIGSLHPDEWTDMEKFRRYMQFKLLEGTGFIVWSYVGCNILARNFNAEDEQMDWERVEELISRSVGRIDWDKQGRYAGRTGEAGANFIKPDVERCLAGE